MIAAALLALRRYTDFGGRSTRREYWSFIALILMALAIAGIAMIVARPSFASRADMTAATASGPALPSCR